MKSKGMKRSDFYIKLTTAVLFVAVASYIGVYIYNAVISTYVTTPAISYSIEETFPAQGYMVRSETVISDVGASALPIVNEGEKVASGQAIAVEYLTHSALETASEIRAIKLKIAKLEASGGVGEKSRLDSLLALSTAVHGGALGALDELSLNIETYIFTSNSATESELPALRERLELLENRNEGRRTIYAPVSGIFSQVIDGYEQIGPRALGNLTPELLTELFAHRSGVSGIGKLITEFKWYYVAVMDAEDAALLQVGKQITVQFTGAHSSGVLMTVENVGRKEEGRCVVLLTCDSRVHEVAHLRELSAEIVYNVVTGIRVPKEAIHLDDDGTTFIYLQTGVSAERVNVEILREAGDAYLVRDGLETGTPLRAGATIIVKANNLFDGKVVA